MQITTTEGDMVDAIALRAYGQRDGRTTAQVLAANPGLCTLPLRLPQGVVITLPAAPEVMTDRRVRLWD